MIILDSHAWIWWASGSSRLSGRANDAIAEAHAVGVCAISCWEVAMLVAKKRLAFRQDIQQWLRMALTRPKIRLIPLEPDIAVLATRLPGAFHGDPADRIIVASCLHYGATLITKDKPIHDWGRVAIAW